jgi:hypothetical protein
MHCCWGESVPERIYSLLLASGMIGIPMDEILEWVSSIGPVVEEAMTALIGQLSTMIVPYISVSTHSLYQPQSQRPD